MIRYATDENDIEDAIKQIMEYIGTQLSADRAFIFECDADGNYVKTYKWSNSEIDSGKNVIKDILYEKDVKVWLLQFKKSHNIVIHDIEEYQYVSEEIYNFLKEQDIHSFVAGPIKIDANIVGFYGVENPPEKGVEDINELFCLMEFVFSTMIKLRNQRRELNKSAYYDQLTGCKNRRALQWAYVGDYDNNSSLTVIMCDLNGLKEVNDKQGHDAGDKFIIRTSQMLSDIFGEDVIYRIGGDEFAVVIIGKTKEEIEEYLSLCKLQIGTTASIGVAYTNDKSTSFVNLMKKADQELYKKKDEFYQHRRKYRE